VSESPPVVERATPSLARRVAWRAWRFAVHALACCGALSIAYHALFEVARMSSSSMAPLLVGEDRSPEPDTILVETCFTAGAAPERFQVVAFRHELGMIVAKRVVGFPGESIAVTPEGKLVVDGVTIDAPPGAGRGRGYIPCGNLHRSRAPFVVPPGEVYLLGDDSQDSDDSRFWGGLPIDRIAGRVMARVWPPSRMAPL
jgi:signal peptidase I